MGSEMCIRDRVSEETGTVSISTRGRLSRDFTEDRLRQFLSAVLMKEQAATSRWARARQHLDLSFNSIARSEDMAKREDTSNGG